MTSPLQKPYEDYVNKCCVCNCPLVSATDQLCGGSGCYSQWAHVDGLTEEDYEDVSTTIMLDDADLSPSCDDTQCVVCHDDVSEKEESALYRYAPIDDDE